MNALIRYRMVCMVLLLVFATASSAADYTGTTPEPTNIHVAIKDGLLTLEAHDVPLHEVMRRIGELVGFETILAKDMGAPSLVDISLQNIPAREAVYRLVANENSTIIYRSKTDDAAGQPIISKVWLLGSSGALVGGDVSNDESIANALEKDVNGHKLDKMITMLQQDRQASVRARAAIALGAMRDERAVVALESALLDTDASVRLQAINALGRIGGDQATMVLGNLLLQGNVDTAERVMAAQALWKQDSEAAKSYLSATVYDINQQIGLASSKPASSSPADGLATKGRSRTSAAQ